MKNLTTLALCATLSLTSLAAWADSPQLEITYRDNAAEQNETHRYTARVSTGEESLVRMISITRTRHGLRNCQISYYGSLGDDPRAVIVENDQSREVQMGYIPLGAPIAGKWQASFACPATGEWELEVAFVNQRGEWDSLSGQNDRFAFRALR